MIRHTAKISKLKSILFEQKSISRQSLIRLSGANPRTVDRCMEELVARQLVSVSMRSPGRGRPYICYAPRPENIRTLHFTVTKDEIYTVICDVRRFPLRVERDEFQWRENRPEMLTGKLTGLAERALQLPDVRRGFISAAGVSLMLSHMPGRHVRQRWSDMLERYFRCDCPVFNSDAFLLSQYGVNNHLTGRMIGISHKGDIQCVAVNGNRIDDDLQFRAEKAVAELGMKNMGFVNYLREFRRNEMKCLEDFAPRDYYNVACMLAMGGDGRALALLRDFGTRLGRIFIRLAESMPVEHLVFMHPRQAVSDGVFEVIAGAGTPCRVQAVNFSPNEFILSPAGYLRRELMEFEHGSILSGGQAGERYGKTSGSSEDSQTKGE